MNKNLNLSSLSDLKINYATLGIQKGSAPKIINYNKLNEFVTKTVAETTGIKILTMNESKELFLSYGKVDEALIADIENMVLDLEAKPNKFSTDILKNLCKIEHIEFKYLEGGPTHVRSVINSTSYNVEGVDTSVHIPHITLQMGIKGEFAQWALIHEMGHALHHEFGYHKVPENYSEIAESARQNMVGKEIYILYLTHSYKKEKDKNKEKIITSLMYDKSFQMEVAQSLQFEDINTKNAIFLEKLQNANLNELGFLGLSQLLGDHYNDVVNYYEKKAIMENQLEIAAYNRASNEISQAMVSEGAICDILASVLGGGFNCKLPNGQELKLILAHDEYYFANTNYQYYEQVANYFAIKMYGDQKALKELRFIMGDDWINMMELQMDEIATNMKNSTKALESIEK